MVTPPKGGAMLSRLVKAALLAAVATVVVQAIPDIKRYLAMRQM
jgi:hypothetical protein